MNPHIQVLLQSVTAPRSAVDLARKHPNPLQLGLTFLIGLCIFELVNLAVVPALLSPIHPQDAAEVDTPSVLDPFWAEGALTAVAYVMMFWGTIWFWKNRTEAAERIHNVESATAVTFASNLVLALPSMVLLRLYENGSISTLLGVLGLLIVPKLVLTTIHFSRALEITLTKSFALNLVLQLIGIVLIMLLVFFVMLVAGEIFSSGAISQ
jgi:hypothetical protein